MPYLWDFHIINEGFSAKIVTFDVILRFLIDKGCFRQ